MDSSPRKKKKKTRKKQSDKTRESVMGELPQCQGKTMGEEGEEETHLVPKGDGEEESVPGGDGDGEEERVEVSACKTGVDREEAIVMTHDDVILTGEATATANGTGRERGRHYTVSIALPGSIIDNAQTQELKTYLAGQIARAAAVFCVDEIIVFDEQGKQRSAGAALQRQSSDPNIFLARLLQYQETPQYLRKTLFPMHHDLKFAGLLNPLDCPHHMRKDAVCQYREGVVTESLTQGSLRKRRRGSQVDCGMRKRIEIDKTLEEGTRVTVKLHTPLKQGTSKLPTGEAVSPSVPRTHAGLYWGYTVRLAPTFSAVFTESPHEGGYDVTLGTSERGESVDDLKTLPSFCHLLIVFGGLKGLEYALECDDTLEMDDVTLLFHHYLNTCPGQGSRTIRTEEALLISLAALRPLVHKNTGQSAR
jgi:predicted SPOUT superfamily RNA methylase MTH1